jgi:indolepyruvate ferredoxin oxidoreductase, beta subunit
VRMRDGVTNVVIAGLGGQGVLKASDILADAVFRAGHDVKKAEVHGMSQRGGSVNSDVRFGCKVYSPMISRGEADYLVVLAADQLEHNRSYLRPGGVLLEPGMVEAERLANKRSINVALMGLLSRQLQLPEDCWLEALAANLPEALIEVNREAFELGRAASSSGVAAGKSGAA